MFGRTAEYRFIAVFICGMVPCTPSGVPAEVLAGTTRLEERHEMPAVIVRQWDAFLLGQIEKARKEREVLWKRDYSSPEAYARSLTANRQHLRHAIGAIDARLPAADLEVVATLEKSAVRAETGTYTAMSVRWPVFIDVHGEGLLLRPKGQVRACVVAIPDADHTPEMLAGISPGVPPESQFARRLAENGMLVLVPTLLDRRTRWSGDDRLDVYTDQSHREWIHRMASDLGRSPIGYEVQKIQAAIDWLRSAAGPAGARGMIGVAGYGEGGLLTLYTAALDERIDAAWVSGYFQPRERVWREPLYRNVWGLLTEFGDAELAAMIAPRALLVEYSHCPEVTHPSPPDPAHKNVRKVGATGRIATPAHGEVAVEWARAKQLVGKLGKQFELVTGAAGAAVAFGSADALKAFGRMLGLTGTTASHASFTTSRPPSVEEVDARQYRQMHELQEFTQARARLVEYEREKFFWSKMQLRTPEEWDAAVQHFRDYFWDEVLGR